MVDYRICTKCIMDTSVPDIEFDEAGVCNYCHLYQARIENELYYNEKGEAELKTIVQLMKDKGAKQEYDCLIGVSGGVDSTYVAYIVKNLGLRPLAVHLDNGWNSELAVYNIESTMKLLNIDLYTHVLDWEEFRELQVAFLKASLANAEIPTDHAINATLFKIASKRKIGYIISGSNLMTEAIMPKSWMYSNLDWRLIKSVHKRCGRGTLKTYPHLSMTHLVYFMIMKRIKFFPILNYVPYYKDEAKQVLLDKLKWRDYGGKHYESIFTRFFQAYLLPQKFNMDKRRPHHSTLILSGQLTREEALNEMEGTPYSAELQQSDQEYIIKKLGFTESEFQEIMDAPPKSYTDFPNTHDLWQTFAPIVSYAKRKATYKRKVI
jgi:N-acetyl sugar amidotransferase